MKVTRSLLLFALVVIVSTVAAVAHLTDATFDIPSLRWQG